MSHDLSALLVDYAMGALAPDVRAQVDAELVRSEELRRELAEIEEALSVLAEGLPPVALDASRKDVLFAGIESQDRFKRFIDPLAQLFDVAKDQVSLILGWLPDTRRWEAGPMPGIEMLRCQPGPKASAWEVGFLRFAAGLVFPPHRHLGEDTVLVMSGEFKDLSSGVLHTSGDLIVKEKGTEHSFVVSDDEPCLLATRFPGIEIL